MKGEEMYPDSSHCSSSAEMQNEIDECEEFDDNGAPYYVPTNDERPGERETREQTGGGGEEEKVTGESSVTTVDTLTAKTSQLNLTEQKKKKNCKKKSKRPKASSDVADISKGKPTAATSADAVPETPTGDAATTGASTISSNKGTPLSPFSIHTHIFLVSIILTVFGQMQGVSGILTKTPVNVLAESGTEVRLPCSTNLTDPVYWLRRLYGASETQTLYYGTFGFSSSVNDRFLVDGNRSNGSYDVIISNVRAEDAGVYICQDDGGMGEKKEMELVVFEYFNCTMPTPPVGFMEKNDIADDDIIRASCSLKCHGNQKPRFQWRWSDNSAVHSTEEDSTSTTIVSTVMTRPRKELNGAKLTCTATVSDQSNAQEDSSSSSSSSSAQWTSREVTVLHASLQPGNVDQCKGSSLILVCNSECEYLEVELDEGLCQCAATYTGSDGQRKFAFSVYSCAAAAGSSQNALIYILPIAFGIGMVTLTIAAIVVIRKYREKSKRGKEQQVKGSPASSEALLP